MPKEEMLVRMTAMRQMVFKYNIYHWVKIYMQRLEEVKTLQLSMKAGRVKDSIRDTTLKKYNESKSRLILLDYDGTLVGFKKQIDHASPDKDLYNLLDRFMADPRNHTSIISGRKHETLEQWFGHTKLDLIAEHGAWRK